MPNYEDEDFSFVEHFRELARGEVHPVDEPDQGKRIDETRIIRSLYRTPARSYEDRNATWAR